MLQKARSTYVVSLASRHLGQLLRAAQALVKLLALLLCARILPVRAVLVRKDARLLDVVPLSVRIPADQLLGQPFAAVHVAHDLFGIGPPEHGAMLHAGAGEALDAAEVQAVGVQARED